MAIPNAAITANALRPVAKKGVLQVVADQGVAAALAEMFGQQGEG